MSQTAKTPVTFRLAPTTLQAAKADALRRGCTLEQWAEEVFEVFARSGFRAHLTLAGTQVRTTDG